MDIYVLKDGQQVGPFTEFRIKQGVIAGEFVSSNLAWDASKSSWQPLSTLINLDVSQPTIHQPLGSNSPFWLRSCQRCGVPYNLFSLTHVWGSGLCRRCSKANPKPTQESFLARPVATRQDALKVVRATAIVNIFLGLFNLVMTWVGLLDSLYLGFIMIAASFALWIWHSRVAAVVLLLIPILGTAFLVLIGEGKALLDAGYWNVLTILQIMLACKAVAGAFKLHKGFASPQLSSAEAG